jgi:hypothetical protein
MCIAWLMYVFFKGDDLEPAEPRCSMTNALSSHYQPQGLSV